MCIYFLLRFEFWVFWSINHSMSKPINTSMVDQLWSFLYPRIKLMLFIPIATYKVLIPICEEPRL